MKRRIMLAVITARGLARDDIGTLVTIHVGTDVWDDLRSQATRAGLPHVDSPSLFGYPVILEHLEDPDHISIRTVHVIH